MNVSPAKRSNVNERPLFTSLLACFKEDGTLIKGKRQEAFDLLWKYYESTLREQLSLPFGEEDVEDALWLFYELFCREHRNKPYTLKTIEVKGLSVCHFLEQFQVAHARSNEWLDAHGYTYYRKEERWLALRKTLIDHPKPPLSEFPQEELSGLVLAKLLEKQKNCAEHPEDTKIVRAIAGRIDQEVIAQYYRESKDKFLSSTHHYRDFSREDALQKAWVELVEKYLDREKIRIEGEYLIGLNQDATLRSLLFRIGQNILAKKARNAHKLSHPGDETLHNHHDLVVAPSSAVDHQQEERKTAIMMKHLRHLPERDQQLIHLFYWEGISLKEIAEIMGYANENTARQRKFRIIQKLKKRLGA